MSNSKKQTPDALNNLGFTLIEVMIVLVIISISVALAVPNFNKILGTYQLDISAREMVSDIRDLQQTAVKKQISTYSITWDIGSDKYLLCNTSFTAYKTVNLPSSVDLVPNGELNKLGFTTSGIPIGGIGGTIHLKDKFTGKDKYVKVDTLGRVRVSETP